MGQLFLAWPLASGQVSWPYPDWQVCKVHNSAPGFSVSVVLAGHSSAIAADHRRRSRSSQGMSVIPPAPEQTTRMVLP
jgi:hypothetical protein